MKGKTQRVRERAGRKEERRKKKEEEEEERRKKKDSREKKKKTKGQKVFRPKQAYRPKWAETGRNGRNGPEQAEILAEVEHRGDSYRLACRYEIFHPFRPEWNGLYNTGL
jgi:hypothetical protein